jgi:hypothetical protein
MIANFAQETSDMWIFLEEGDLALLDGEVLEGKVIDTGRPGEEPGTLSLEYDEGYDNMRPAIVRESRDTVDDFEVIVGERQYPDLAEGELYHGRVGAYQELPEASKLWILPPENRGEYDYMMDDLDFYREFGEEERQQYRQRVND